ncbi:MAG: hypothetical protein QM831_42055 [Kofleriaceae bacterium]
MRWWLLLLIPGSASADTPVRDPEATLPQIFHGPFSSSRLFAMPTADVIGAYMLSVSYDGSLLQQPGVLTSAGVLAAGFGDIAQLEYRHTSAISLTGVNAPVPTVGVQVEAPLPEWPYVPRFGVAVHIGVPRTEQIDGTSVTETVNDFYFVTRERLGPYLTLHGGVRVSPAKLQEGDQTLQRTLALPAAGIELRASDSASVIAEAAAVPQFMHAEIMYGFQARLGLRWRVIPSATFDASIGYQLSDDLVQQWDIRLGAEVFVPWGALVCRATGAFCEGDKK